MEIKIDTGTLIDTIGAVFLMESGSDNPIPPEGILKRYVIESVARLTLLVNNYVLAPWASQGSNNVELPAELSFYLNVTPRRIYGKLQAVTDLVHSFLNNMTLQSVYVNASLPELANKHQQQAQADAVAINTLLSTKIAPIL